MDEFELPPVELPPIPEPLADTLAPFTKLFEESKNRESELLILRARVKFVQAATDAALADMNKQLDSAKRDRAAAMSDARTEAAEAAALAAALAKLLEYVPLDPQDPYPQHLCYGQQKTRAEAEEVLKLYHEKHD